MKRFLSKYVVVSKNCKVIFVAFVLLLSGCKKDRLTDEKAVFIGKWGWSHSEATLDICNGFPQYDVLLTPISEGVTYHMDFLKKGKVFFYKENALIDSDRIVFEAFGPEYYACGGDYNGFEIKLDNYDGTDVQNIIGGCIKSDTLIIHNGFS